MKFGHPDQQVHMMKGVEKAIASPNTPPHLKAHLQKRLGKMKLGTEKLPKVKTPAPAPESSSFYGDFGKPRF